MGLKIVLLRKTARHSPSREAILSFDRCRFGNLYEELMDRKLPSNLLKTEQNGQNLSRNLSVTNISSKPRSLLQRSFRSVFNAIPAQYFDLIAYVRPIVN